MTPVYVVFPTANAPLASSTLSKWKASGYMTAVLANGAAFDAAIGSADFILREPAYRGWGRSINHLVNCVAGDWIVAAGDDMLPPSELKPWEIARQCTEHFAGTFGVMQCTGDRLGEDANGVANADRICVSPFLGREFIKRWNGGRGPLWDGYFHYFADEELAEAANARGLLWRRRDLTLHHAHHSIGENPRMPYHDQILHWHCADNTIFNLRRPIGFPGHEPL